MRFQGGPGNPGRLRGVGSRNGCRTHCTSARTWYRNSSFALSIWRRNCSFDFSLVDCLREEEIRGQQMMHCVLRISCSLEREATQERVDTGTSLFCPVVVAS